MKEKLFSYCTKIIFCKIKFCFGFLLPDKEVLFTLNGNPILVAKHHEIQKQFLKGIHAGEIGIKFILRNDVEKYTLS